MKSRITKVGMFLAVIFPIAIAAQDAQPMIGNSAPAFELSALDGTRYSLEKFKGHYVVIHFAATWCPFCNAEAPYLEELYKSYRDKGVDVIIINVMEDKALIEKNINRFNISFPVLHDADGKVSSTYAPEGVQPALARHEVPIASNLIIDREGKIRFYSLLNTTAFDAKLTKLQQKLDELLMSN